MLTILLLTGALVAPVARAQTDEVPPGIGIGLREGPANRQDDPRALVYVVDHLNPGATISRRFEVMNGTDEAVRVRLYPAAARVADGAFTIIEGRSENELTGWVEVDPGEVTLEPGGRASARLSIAVPNDATNGEHYAAVVAELPPIETDSPIVVAQRVGIRIYLSVGEGSEPESDFEVDSLAAGRDDEGRPVVRTAVRNTGGRAVDLTGELRLLDGPGGIEAGPFAVKVPATLAPDDEAPVTVTLDGDLPAGPWLARVSLRSGELERTAEAAVTFPDTPGTFAEPVDAEDVAKQRRILGPIAGALVAVVLAALAAYALDRRRKQQTNAR